MGEFAFGGIFKTASEPKRQTSANVSLTVHTLRPVGACGVWRMWRTRPRPAAKWVMTDGIAAPEDPAFRLIATPGGIVLKRCEARKPAGTPWHAQHYAAGSQIVKPRLLLNGAARGDRSARKRRRRSPTCVGGVKGGRA